MSIRARHDWDAGQACWRPSTDEWGNTDIEAVQVLGDAAGIDGAAAAEMAGRIAALEAMRALGRIDTAERDRMSAPDARALRRDRRVRPFLEALFRPPDAILADDVVVCRCEEVTAGDIRSAAVKGCKGANEVKYATRCGIARRPHNHAVRKHYRIRASTKSPCHAGDRRVSPLRKGP